MRCPGQDSRYWREEAIFEVECPACGSAVEFFKDDGARVCRNCSHRFLNPRMDFGCAAYCPYAEQCLGGLPEGLTAKGEDRLKERLAREVKRRLGTAFKRIGRVTRTARYAEEIAENEGATTAVCLAAAYLLELISGAEGEVPGVATEVLLDVGAGAELAREVAGILERYPKTDASSGLDLKVLHDAGRIASLEGSLKEGSLDAETLRRVVEQEMLTRSGRELARRVLLGGPGHAP